MLMSDSGEYPRSDVFEYFNQSGPVRCVIVVPAAYFRSGVWAAEGIGSGLAIDADSRDVAQQEFAGPWFTRILWVFRYVRSEANRENEGSDSAIRRAIVRGIDSWSRAAHDIRLVSRIVIGIVVRI